MQRMAVEAAEDQHVVLVAGAGHVSVEALCADTQLAPAQVRIALAHRDAYPEEIAAVVEDNRRPLADVETLYPFVEVAGRKRMRLLLDANLSPKRIGLTLEDQGHDVLALAADPAVGALDDPDVLALAAREGRVLVTGNAKDFAPLLREWAEVAL
jgi:hypothetical protein